MKKLLLSGSIGALLLPGLAFAAYNDVSLTTDTVLTVSSINANVSSATAVIESIEVGSSNFIVTLKDGSSFQVTAPNLNKLSTDTSVGLVLSNCDGRESVLGYSVGSTVSVTITPSGTLCANASNGPSVITSTTNTTTSGTSTVTASVAPVASVQVPKVQVATPEVIAAIKAQLVDLIKQLIAMLIQQLQQQIQAMQASGNY